MVWLEGFLSRVEFSKVIKELLYVGEYMLINKIFVLLCYVFFYVCLVIRNYEE